MSPLNSGSDAIVIPLHPDSLYICLVQIPIPDKFHWALYITDPQGIATCHQWTEHVGARDAGKAEGYKIDVLPVVTDMTESNAQNIAFVRIGAYRPPATSSPEYMTRLFDGIFEGYATIFENRRKGITCRTWLMRALERLRCAGHLSDLGAAEVAAFEQAAIAVGRRVEVPIEVDGNLRIVTEVTAI